MWTLLLGLIPKSLKTPIAGILGIILLIAGVYIWHILTLNKAVSEAEDAKDREWKERLIAGIDSVTKSMTIEEEARPPVKAELHHGKVFTSREVEAAIDSAFQAWQEQGASKDSLFRHYLRPRKYQDTTSYTVVDTLIQEEDGIQTVQVQTRSYELPVIIDFDPLKDKVDLLAALPPIYIRREQIKYTSYVPLPVKWYESGTAHFVYGVAAVGITYGILRALTKH